LAEDIPHDAVEAGAGPGDTRRQLHERNSVNAFMCGIQP
jgi:hypothetical protein